MAVLPRTSRAVQGRDTRWEGAGYAAGPAGVSSGVGVHL